MSVCDWCLREVDNRHPVPADNEEDLDDMVCDDCDPDENGGGGR